MSGLSDIIAAGVVDGTGGEGGTERQGGVCVNGSK